MRFLIPRIVLALVCLQSWSWAAERPLLGGGAVEIVQQGGAVMVVILLGSVLGLALAFERAVSLRPRQLLPKDLVEALREGADSGSFAKAQSLASQGDSPLARIVAAGLRRTEDPADMEKCMEAFANREIQRLKRPVRPIAILASVMPLLGLLGTILGMISTFNGLEGKNAAERVAALAPGIGQALYTTAAGLTVSIPFILLFHHLNGQIQRAAGEWSVLGTELVVARGRSLSKGTP